MKIISTLFLGLVALNLSGQMYLEQPHDSNNPYANFTPGHLNPAAPPETEQMGQLVGMWRAQKITRQQDGTWSTDTLEADWIWYYILDGHAIQDDYILPPMDTEVEGGHRFFGTNIRIYNPDEKQWEMAWTEWIHRKIATFTATSDDGKIIMKGMNNGRLIKNTFYNIKSDSFDWVQEWTFDEEKTWTPVVKIHCDRMQ